MATFAEQDQRAMIRVIADIPITFSANDPTATTFTDAGAIGALVTTEPNDAGFEVTPDLTITTTLKKLDTDGTTLVDRFTTAPDNNDLIGYNGGVYRVDQTHQDEITSALVLDLVLSSR